MSKPLKPGSKSRPEPQAHIAQKNPVKTDRNGKRKHVRTNNPKGGWRPNAGRKLGIPNDLPNGAITAIKAINVRIPDGTPDDQVAVANKAFERVCDVMMGKVHSSIAQPVLRAATHVREEICGSVARNLNVKAEASLTGILDEMTTMEQSVKPPGPVEAKGPIIRKRLAAVAGGAVKAVMSEEILPAEDKKD